MEYGMQGPEENNDITQYDDVIMDHVSTTPSHCSKHCLSAASHDTAAK